MPQPRWHFHPNLIGFHHRNVIKPRRGYTMFLEKVWDKMLLEVMKNNSYFFFFKNVRQMPVPNVS